MILALMLFGFPAMIVAEKKGFAESRWLISLGPIGLIIVCCLPSAKTKRVSYDKSRIRLQRANRIGATLCAINLVVGALVTLISVFVHAFTHRP